MLSKRATLAITLLPLAAAARPDVYWSYKEPEITSIRRELKGAKHDAFIAAVGISDPKAIRLLESAQARGLVVRILVERPTALLSRSHLKDIRVCQAGEIHNLSYVNGWKVTEKGPKEGWRTQSIPGTHGLYIETPPDPKIPKIPEHLGSVMVLDNKWMWNGPETWSPRTWTGHSYGCSHGFFDIPPLHELGLDELWRHSRRAR